MKRLLVVGLLLFVSVKGQANISCKRGSRLVLNVAVNQILTKRCLDYFTCPFRGYLNGRKVEGVTSWGSEVLARGNFEGKTQLNSPRFFIISKKSIIFGEINSKGVFNEKSRDSVTCSSI